MEEPVDKDKSPQSDSSEARPLTDMDEGTHVGFIEADEAAAGLTQLELHVRKHANDPAHVDLLQEEYTPQEAALLIGTSLDVVMHAIWYGDLKAERQGKNVVCISHADLTDWLLRRAKE
jgi:hypothetical protein